MGLSLKARILEVVEELTEEQQRQLWGVLQTLRKANSRRLEGEPQLYIELDQDSLSFEIPPDRLMAVLCRMAEILRPPRIRMRFAQDGRKTNLSMPPRLQKVLKENEEVLQEGVVILEFGRDTLYSNGGGCLLLMTSADDEVKKQIARSALEICGFPHEVSGSRFKALVRRNRLEVLEA